MATRRPKNLLAKHLPEILLVSGALLVLLSTAHNLIRLHSLRLDKSLVRQYLIDSAEVAPAALNYPVHISIPWYVDVDISPQIYQDGSWTISPSLASYLTASALPGNSGNIIIYGHNKRTILGNLRALKGHEIITLTLTDGTTRRYQVESLVQVPPTQTQLLLPTDTEVLTLYTCAGLMDSQRFVVRAKPLIDPVSSP